MGNMMPHLFSAYLGPCPGAGTPPVRQGVEGAGEDCPALPPPPWWGLSRGAGPGAGWLAAAEASRLGKNFRYLNIKN